MNTDRVVDTEFPRASPHQVRHKPPPARTSLAANSNRAAPNETRPWRGARIRFVRHLTVQAESGLAAGHIARTRSMDSVRQRLLTVPRVRLDARAPTVLFHA